MISHFLAKLLLNDCETSKFHKLVAPSYRTMPEFKNTFFETCWQQLHGYKLELIPVAMRLKMSGLSKRCGLTQRPHRVQPFTLHWLRL